MLAWYDRHAACCHGDWRLARTARRTARSLPRLAVRNHAAADHGEGGRRPITRAFWRGGRRSAALAAASLDDVLRAWAGLGYYARARNLHACAKEVVRAARRNISRAISTALRALPGIGDYTAAAVAAIAFDVPAVPVDGNVERVVTRLFAVEEALPAAKPKIKQLAASLLPRAARRRFRASVDGSRRHHLLAETSGLRAVSVERVMRGARARRPGNISRARRRSAKANCGAARPSSRCAPTAACCCASARTRACSASMTEVPGSDWAHDFDEKSALRAAPRLKGAKWQRAAGRRASCVHAFSARAGGLRRDGAAPDARRQRTRVGRPLRALPAKPCPTSCAKSLSMRSTVVAEASMTDGEDRARGGWSPSLRYPDPLVHSLDGASTNTGCRSQASSGCGPARAGARGRSGSATGAICSGATCRATACCAGTRKPARSACSASHPITPTATRATGRAG